MQSHSKQWQIQGGHPPTVQNFLNFMQFIGKFGKIVCWYPPRGLAPPPTILRILDPPLVNLRCEYNLMHKEWTRNLSSMFEMEKKYVFIFEIERFSDFGEVWNTKFLRNVDMFMWTPGFSRGGCTNSQKCYYIAYFLPKTAWKWKNLGPQGAACIPGGPPWIHQWD